MILYTIPITLLSKIYNAFDAAFFSTLIKEHKTIGKENPTHFIINTNVFINNPYHIEHINIYNTLMQVAQRKCQMLQILKNQ